MKYIKYTLFSLTILLTHLLSAQHTIAQDRIAIVSSYHREFLWESETNEGVLKALTENRYINEKEAGKFTRDEYIETPKIVLKKWWMDSKRKSTLAEMQREITRIIGELQEFKPTLVITGDDNATNYLGNYFIDSEIPLVFYGVNGNPMKYGLLDSLEQPGRNITGVYQADYLKESVDFLVSLLPETKTIAILSDDSVSSRAKVKKLIRLHETNQLPADIVTTITTNNVDEWKKLALKASQNADAFFMLNHNTLKEPDGTPVNNMEIGAWYLKNIKKPEISYEQHFIVEGMFAAVSDSGVKQGYNATLLGIQVLQGKNPGLMAVTAPERGDYVVNKERATMLNVYDKIKNNPQIEAWVTNALALKQYP